MAVQMVEQLVVVMVVKLALNLAVVKAEMLALN